ncbi:hypothetical protein Gorai_004048 [Gossypium raimondii]|uniref:Reverse transcriptase zinc-binding domain-containing protein n=1 Tax=Gossypium raimondii TaxID=29730 RepID=A0A7J8QH34_GOSRA|nr:hypothetical protein [Gossypium raimondii]
MTPRFGFDRWGFEDLDGNSLRASFNGIWDEDGLWAASLILEDYLETPCASQNPYLCQRVGHNLLPTNVKMATIFHDFDRTCHRCEIGNETIIHALRDCPKARVVLSFGGLDGRLLDSPFESGID